MSRRDQVDVVRRIWDAWARRDSESALALYDPEIEAVSHVAIGAWGTYRGHDGLRRWMADFSELFDEFAADPDEFRQVGDKVVVRVRMSGRGKRSGAFTEFAFWIVYRVAGDRVVGLESFAAEAEALNAAGVEE